MNCSFCKTEQAFIVAEDTPDSPGICKKCMHMMAFSLCKICHGKGCARCRPGHVAAREKGRGRCTIKEHRTQINSMRKWIEYIGNNVTNASYWRTSSLQNEVALLRLQIRDLQQAALVSDKLLSKCQKCGHEFIVHMQDLEGHPCDRDWCTCEHFEASHIVQKL